jgi:hypothetical protein
MFRQFMNIHPIHPGAPLVALNPLQRLEQVLSFDYLLHQDD